ncbi:MAG: EAL domain-containing protein [Burkholderiales bacterium]
MLPLLVVTALLLLSGTLPRVNGWIYDAYVRMDHRPPPDDVAIVSVDAASLDALGQWPWSRAVHGALVRRLTTVRPKAIAFDVAFHEVHAGDPAGDTVLANAMTENGRVVLPVFPERMGPAGAVREAGPIPVLAHAAARLGHADVELDADQVSRRVFLYAGLGSARWPSLALATWDVGEGGTVHDVAALARPMRTTLSGRVWIRDREAMVRFGRAPGSIRQVSYERVLRDDRALAELAGKYVLVGVTAPGLAQMIATPVSTQDATMSGVEFNANVLSALRDQALVRPVTSGIEWLACVLALLIPAVLYPRTRPSRALLVVIGGACGVLGWSYLLLDGANLWLPPALPLGVLTAGYPVWLWTRLVRAAGDLEAQQQQARATLQSIADAVVTIRRDGTVVQMNAGAETMSGIAERDAIGLRVDTVFKPVSPRDHELLTSAILACERDAAMQRPSGHLVVSGYRAHHCVRLSVSPLVAAPDHGGRMVLAMSDVTDTVAMTQRMAHLATHDALTGLPNRALLTDRLGHAITAAQRENTQLAVMFVDLDGFKRINDSLGHTLGDALLEQVARRIQERCRASDTVARWGGDEFVVLLESVAYTEIVGRVAHGLLEFLSEPYFTHQRELHISASVGIATYPKDGQDGETLLANADAAMYRAKQSGRNACCFYSEAVDSRARRQMELETQLRSAGAARQFELYFQPQISLRDGHIAGVEALIRWRHPTLGLLAPAHFIPLAEESDVILEIGEWALREACLQWGRWQQSDLAHLKIAVNVSARQLVRRDLAKTMRRILDETGTDARGIVMEVTESVVMHDVERVATALRALKGEGVGIAVDDFGTGYSSLAHLKRFPIDQLKIDQSFVRGVNSDPDDAAIASAVVALARSLGMCAVAEGIETAAQLSFLRERGCDEGQGFYFGPPMPAADVMALAREHHSIGALAGAANELVDGDWSTMPRREQARG